LPVWVSRSTQANVGSAEGIGVLVQALIRQAASNHKSVRMMMSKKSVTQA